MPFQSLDTCTRDVLDAARALVAVTEGVGSPAALNQARERAAAAMRAHHAATDTVLLAALRESDDCAHHAMARRVLGEDHARRELLTTHFATWTVNAIRSEPTRYRGAVRQLLRMFERRIAYQEQVLLPMTMDALSAVRVAA